MNNRATYSTAYLARRVQKVASVSRKDAAFAVQVTMRAIHDMLLDGYPVTLPKIGRLWFGFRKGRVVNSTNPRSRMPRVQPDSHPLKFTQSPFLQRKLKSVIPKHQPRLKASPAQITRQSGKPL